MKFFLWFFGILVFLAVGYVIIYNLNEKKGGWGKAFSDSLSATSAEQEVAPRRTPTPEEYHQQYLKTINSHTQATGTVVQVTGFEGRKYQITLLWPENKPQAGSEYLQALVNADQIRDFQEVKPPVVGKIQGTDTFRAEYLLNMKKK